MKALRYNQNKGESLKEFWTERLETSLSNMNEARGKATVRKYGREVRNARYNLERLDGKGL